MNTPLAAGAQTTSSFCAQEAVSALSATQSDVGPWWAQCLYEIILGFQAAGRLGPQADSLLTHSGFTGQANSPALRAEALEAAMRDIDAMPSMPTWAGASPNAANTCQVDAAQSLRWHAQLPPTMKRAALRLIKTAGQQEA